MKSRYSDNRQAPMAPGETRVKRASEGPRYTERTSAANAYPAGCVPEETGAYGHDGDSISRLPGHNRITVCRGRKFYRKDTDSHG